MKCFNKYLIFLLLSTFFAGVAHAKFRMFAVTGLSGRGGEVSPQWEPGFGRIAFLKVNTFFIYNLDSSEKPKPITIAGKSAFHQLAFAWSPTGDHKFVVLSSEKDGRLGLYLGQDYQLTRKLVDFPQGGEGIRFSKLSFSDDGKEILYSDNAVLYKISVEAGSRPEKLIKDDVLPGNSGAQSWGVFNPKDKNLLAFQLESEGREAIYVYDSKRNKIIGAVKGKFSACHPSWSPDGEKLAFFFSRIETEDGEEESDQGLELSWKLRYVTYNQAQKKISQEEIAVDDSIRRKAPFADFTPICWTPDSKKIIYTRYGKENSNHLMVYNLKEGRTKKITLGDRIDINSSRGYSTSWKMKIIYSDVSSTCVENKCYLAFAADVDIGESTSKIITTRGGPGAILR